MKVVEAIQFFMLVLYVLLELFMPISRLKRQHTRFTVKLISFQVYLLVKHTSREF